MQSFWNERYAAPEYAYGKAPNVFLASRLPDFPAGRILFPAEGEGRNAVFAARLGWEAHAFDYSESARMKALQLAQEQGVQLQYAVADVRELDYEPAAFDAIAIIFAHFPSSFRAHCHQVWDRLLKPGGGLRFATDWAEYADWTRKLVAASGLFRGPLADPAVPPADHLTTRYEEKKLGDCAPVFLDYARV